MRLAKLDVNILDKKLATPIMLKNDTKLVSGGVQITEKLIKRLKEYGFHAVYIEDPSVDVELTGDMSETVRSNIIGKLNEMYNRICDGSFDEFAFSRLIREDIFPEISHSRPVSLSVCRPFMTDDISLHSLNVCLLSMGTAIKVGLDMRKIEILGKAALFHDIGKLMEDDKRHAGHEQKAFELLKDYGSSVLLYTAVRYHHETLDGTGPYRLPAEKQTDIVRILSICNYFERLFSVHGMLPHQCFEEINSLVDEKFDRYAFEALAKSVWFYPVGLPVRLNNDEMAVVVGQNDLFPFRPIVQTENARYNLMKDLSLNIAQVLL